MTGKQCSRSLSSTRRYCPPLDTYVRVVDGVIFALDHELRDAGGHGLHVVRVKPACRAARCQAYDAQRVHIGADFGPYSAREMSKGHALSAEELELTRTGSPYAIAPGTLMNRWATLSRSSLRSTTPGWSTGCATQQPRYVRPA